MYIKYYEATKSGRAFNSAHRDSGTIVHAVSDNSYPSWNKALCGAKPGSRGNGWHFENSNAGDIRFKKKEVTCIKCLSKILRWKI